MTRPSLAENFTMLWKERFNTDGQQCQQYQQNKQSPLIVIHCAWQSYDIGNIGLGLGQAQQYGGVKPVHGTPTPLLITWSIYGNTLSKRLKKTCVIFTSHRRCHPCLYSYINSDIWLVYKGIVSVTCVFNIYRLFADGYNLNGHDIAEILLKVALNTKIHSFIHS